MLFRSIILTFLLISSFIDIIISDIFFVASSDESDNFLISFATTPNPLPASPALAASIDALSESKLVFFDISPNISNIKIIFLISFHKILLKIM